MNQFSTKLIAPCGMDCALCLGYLREENHCPGCGDMATARSCRQCVIRNCEILKENGWSFCSDKCDKYPCRRLKNLDKRYRTKYGMSMIENLEYIKQHGIRKFVEKEKQKWTCQQCGGTICVHRGVCSACGEVASS